MLLLSIAVSYCSSWCPELFIPLELVFVHELMCFPKIPAFASGINGIFVKAYFLVGNYIRRCQVFASGKIKKTQRQFENPYRDPDSAEAGIRLRIHYAGLSGS